MSARQKDIRISLAAEARKDTRLKASGYRVYNALLFKFCRKGKLYCYPGNQTIAHQCGMCSRTVSRQLTRLAELGYIRRTEGQGRGNRTNIHILHPEILDGESTSKSSGERVTSLPGKGDKLSSPYSKENKQEFKQEPLKVGTTRYSVGSVTVDRWETYLKKEGLPPLSSLCELIDGAYELPGQFPPGTSNGYADERAGAWLEQILSKYNQNNISGRS